MTTSAETPLKSAISREEEKLSAFELGYFSERAKNNAHAKVLDLFFRLSKEEGVNKAFLARRLGKKPEQITRWLAAPGNWTLDTLSNLLVAMGYEPTFDVRELKTLRNSNHSHSSRYSSGNEDRPILHGNITISSYVGRRPSGPIAANNSAHGAIITEATETSSQ